MPRGAPESRGEIPRSASSPATTKHNVMSRSAIPRTRKPPRRGASGGPLGEMRASTARDQTKTPMSNRQRLATRAAMELSMSMSMDGLDALVSEDDEESLMSNVSAGSEALKAPSPRPKDRERSSDRSDARRVRSSSQKASTARQRERERRSGRSRSGSSDERVERPSSVLSIDAEPPRATSIQSLSSTGSRSSTTSNSNSHSRSDDSSSRGEHRMDRRSSRHRSRSRKRDDRRRSSSLNEKRNGRSQRISNSKFAPAANGRAGQAPLTSGTLNREKVTEKEIMELLSLDYEMPLTDAPDDAMDRKLNSSSSSLTDGGTSRSQRRNRSGSVGKPPSRRTKSPMKGSQQDTAESTHSARASRTAGLYRDSKINRGGDIAQSSHSVAQSVASTSTATRRRRVPQRSKSSASAEGDHGLDNFLQQNMSVSRRKKATSGSRSVASMPASAKGRRRRVSISQDTKTMGVPDMDDDNNYEDYEEDIESKQDTKGSSYRSGGGSSATFEQSDDDDDAASIDLDLATAQNFQQKSFNDKLQLHLSRTDNLLYSVFPKHVADALRNGQKVEPENHDEVTIFFSDIKGFTDISSKLDPIKISDMLDRLYHSFDALSDYHDVFKVETIGDAYMAVTNLAKKQSDHAKRIAEFSIDAIRVANQTLIDEDDPSLGFVNIRVGFHSGPVVSNVVGTRNPRYCLFGDTVNTASRMESNSECNRIHCSETSAKLLKEQCPKIRIFPRGTIDVKGKGEMKTYWIHTEGSFSAGPSSSTAASGDKKQNIFNAFGSRLRREKVST